MKEIARRINYFTAVFTSVLGFSLTSEIFMEDGVPDKIDDIFIVVLSAVAIFWYLSQGHKASRTLGSILLLAGGIAIKALAIAIEHADKEAVGDDYGVISALIFAFIFVVWQTIANKTLN